MKIGQVVRFKHKHNGNECFILLTKKRRDGYWEGYDPERAGMKCLLLSEELTPLKPDEKVHVYTTSMT